MKKRISIGTSIVLVLFFCIATFLITANAFQTQHNKELACLNKKTAFYDKLSEVYDKVADSFIKDTTSEDMTDAYLSEYIDSLGDRYSTYLAKDEMEAYTAETSGDLVGIGVHVAYDSDSGGIYISNVMKNSPALEAGIQAGDIIIQVGDIVISSDTYYEAINAVKGKAGEAVSLVIKRRSENISISVVRAEIESESVIYEKLDGNIAYVSILEFNNYTAEAFKESLENAKNDGCTKFIFDVRNNPGGDLDAIVSVLDTILPEGPIINIIDKSGNAETKNSDAAFLDYPMVVICNGNTASAGELFTAALRDYELAKIVGTTTFGKGTMQTIYSLPDGSGLKISTAYYNPPSNISYDGTGILPDFEVVMSDEDMARFYKLTKEEDNQLQKAIEIINSEIID
ncbi:MAG: S41 family peptidase [Eubacteriales bacterium]|nr:S41 family peptidase [Eubacteriales bacterium]MDD4421643.1 S41 family peptidase [Eubacteriales bacterium]